MLRGGSGETRHQRPQARGRKVARSHSTRQQLIGSRSSRPLEDTARGYGTQARTGRILAVRDQIMSQVAGLSQDLTLYEIVKLGEERVLGEE